MDLLLEDIEEAEVEVEAKIKIKNTERENIPEADLNDLNII